MAVFLWLVFSVIGYITTSKLPLDRGIFATVEGQLFPGVLHGFVEYGMPE